jgi:hypothetical protein
MIERDKARFPDLETFSIRADWPSPRMDEAYEPIHPSTTPLDDPEDRAWQR